jgi:lysozyme family protein
LPTRDVYLMQNAERDAIYRAQFWDAIKGDDLPSGISYVVFDGAVNSGASQSVKWLQRALGVKVDGNIGQATVAAAVAGDPATIIADICARRMAFLQELRTWPTYGKGWARRVNEVYSAGMSLAGGVAPSLAASAAPQKAPIALALGRPSPAGGDAATGGGVAVGTLVAALQSARDSLTPLSSSAVVTKILVVLTIVSVTLTLGGVLLGMYQRRRSAARSDALDLPNVVQA